MEINWERIPSSPGVYLWKDKNDHIIYIGKAKNLRNRMKQYFNKNISPKTQLLVKYIVDYDFQVCSSEIEALILEETLINEYEPKYNIKIKSAKKYPYIEFKFKNDLNISVSKTQKFNKSAKYYGPFPDGFNARKIISLLKSVLPLDKCLGKENDFKPCLNYQMNKCLGQCINKNIEQKKFFVINMVEDFFKGNTRFFEENIKEKIELNNKMLNFEESKKLVEHLELIKKLNEQKITKFNDTMHRDVINYYSHDGIISISIMTIRFGNINLTSNYMNKQFNPNSQETVESFINRYYESAMIPDEIIIPFELEWEFKKVKVTVPKSGTKKELLNLVKEHTKSKYNLNINKFINGVKGFEQAMDLIKSKFLNDKTKEIRTIELVDISSTMGSQQVGAIVCFENGEPKKSLYRKFIVKDVNKMDDYSSIEEVTRRHFLKKIEKNEKFPDVYIVDGKHQLKVVQKVFSNLKINDIVFFGLVKDLKHRTKSIIKIDNQIIDLKSGSLVHLFFTKMQDEIHRFVLQYHQMRRQRTILESELDKFLFLSENDKNNLFKEFKSIRKIMIATDTELKKVISQTKARKIIEEKNKWVD